MLLIITLAALTIAGTVTATADDTGCGTFRSKAGQAAIDLAPPVGFVEICAQDADLCSVLTAGYPKSVTTLGYFVTPDEWKRYKTGPIGFTKYLIAQLAGSMSPADLPGLKDHIRSNQGSIPDHTELPHVLASQGRVPIPVFEDTPDAVAYGVIMKLRPRVPTPVADMTLASTNAALVVKGKVLTLYACVAMTEEKDVERVKTLTRNWLNCLRTANKP